MRNHTDQPSTPNQAGWAWANHLSTGSLGSHIHQVGDMIAPAPWGCMRTESSIWSPAKHNLTRCHTSDLPRAPTPKRTCPQNLEVQEGLLLPLPGHCSRVCQAVDAEKSKPASD